MKSVVNRTKIADKVREKLRLGVKEKDVYDRLSRDALVEEDELAPWEAGFMEGAEKGGQRAKCAGCGVILSRDSTVERKIAGKLLWFCSQACTKKFKKEH
ncbi:hypothetical protein HZB03_01920 [Candidatus Woesearchaeota archaeon]|nr:hypothetical protein [Candidatus Woesearchaeota archaeon]